MRGTPIQLLERIKDLQAFRGDGPIPHFPVDQPVSEDIEVRRSASDPRHAGGPLRPATVIDSEVLLDDLDTRAPAWLAGKYLQYG